MPVTVAFVWLHVQVIMHASTSEGDCMRYGAMSTRSGIGQVEGGCGDG